MGKKSNRALRELVEMVERHDAEIEDLYGIVGSAPQSAAPPTAQKKAEPKGRLPIWLVLMVAAVGFTCGGFPGILWLFYVGVRDYASDGTQQPTPEEAAAQQDRELGHFRYERKVPN